MRRRASSAEACSPLDEQFSFVEDAARRHALPRPNRRNHRTALHSKDMSSSEHRRAHYTRGVRCPGRRRRCLGVESTAARTIRPSYNNSMPRPRTPVTNAFDVVHRLDVERQVVQPGNPAPRNDRHLLLQRDGELVEKVIGRDIGVAFENANRCPSSVDWPRYFKAENVLDEPHTIGPGQ